MANWSNFELTLSGHPFKLKQARDKFIECKFDFNIGDIADEQFTHEPPTWNLQAEARWGADLDKLVEFLTPYQLSGTITDEESGSDYFNKVWLENGIVINNVCDEYMSDAHYEHCPDNEFWFCNLDWALEEPEDNKEQIQFMLKHNIITQEYLDECIQKNKSNQL